MIRKNSVHCSVTTYFTLMLGDLLALFLFNNMTILGRNMVTNLFVNKFTDLLGDNITFGFSTFRTLFLLDWST